MRGRCVLLSCVLIIRGAMSGLRAVADDASGEGLSLVVAGAGGETSSMAGPLPLDADGRLALALSLVLADGSLLPLLPKGSPPASAEALVSTAADGQTEVAIALVAAARPTAAGARLLLSTSLTVARAARGRAQVLVTVRARARVLRLTCAEIGGAGARSSATATGAAPFAPAPLLDLPRPWRVDVGAPHGAFYLNGTTIALEQRDYDAAAAEKPPLGADGDVDAAFTASRVWPAAYDLATFLGRRGAWGDGLLELGAGAGLVGVAAAAAYSAEAVVMTDLEANLPLLRRNAANASGVTVAPLDWTAALPEAMPRYSVVAAADCVFWPSLFDPLLDTIARLLAREPGAVAFVSVTHRLDRTKRFLGRVGERGWSLEERAHPGKAPQTSIYELRPPSPLAPPTWTVLPPAGEGGTPAGAPADPES